MNWADIRVLTFDCYGTLIDWEGGILGALTPVLRAHDVHAADTEVLELFAELERGAEQGPFRDYKSVLRLVMDGFAERYHLSLGDEERSCLVRSLKHWMPFPDTVDALATLKERFKLAVISNIDDDLFSFTSQRLGVSFDWVMTAGQVKSYKPSLNNFNVAIQRIGAGSDRIVHVAQSLYHDIAPANQLGLSCVWVNRRLGRVGHGATAPGNATPDIVVPDLLSLVTLINS